MDFTISIYTDLLKAFRGSGYSFITFKEYCEGKCPDKYIILRHDIDKKPENAFRFALLENELGIKSTYFFLVNKSVFKVEIIQKITSLGHEVGYHYRDLVDAKGNEKQAIESFQNNLEKFRAITSIYTIAMDGCPWSNYDNRNIWQKYDYKDFGIIGEPYFDINFNEVLYLTDTGRSWDGEKYSVRDRVNSSYNFHFKSTKDIIKALELDILPDQIMITTHPQRWTNNMVHWFIELMAQSAKNLIKRILIKQQTTSI